MDDPQTPLNPTPEPQEPNDQPASTPPSESESVAVTLDQIVQVLSLGEMEAPQGMMRFSSNYTFLVNMTHNGICLPAIYKPRKGERPLWDFPDGTLYKRERAAYLTSEFLEWTIVPPTVIRDGLHGIGSLQFYIDHDPDEHYFTFDESVLPQLARMALFDVIVNNADRKGGHLLLDTQGRVWGIDHGITFNKEHKLRTVIWDFAGQIIPQILLDDVNRLCETLKDPLSDYRKALDDLLLGCEIEAFEWRVERLLRTQRYPQPGSGPNYPWPAV